MNNFTHWALFLQRRLLRDGLRSRWKVSKQVSFEELIWVFCGSAIRMRQNKCAFITEQDQKMIALHIL